VEPDQSGPNRNMAPSLAGEGESGVEGDSNSDDAAGNKGGDEEEEPCRYLCFCLVGVGYGGVGGIEGTEGGCDEGEGESEADYYKRADPGSDGKEDFMVSMGDVEHREVFCVVLQWIWCRASEEVVVLVR